MYVLDVIVLSLRVPLIDFVKYLQEGLMRHAPRCLLYVRFDHIVGLLLENGICRGQAELLIQLLNSLYLKWIYENNRI